MEGRRELQVAPSVQHELRQDYDILPHILECYTAVCRGSLADAAAASMLEQFRGTLLTSLVIARSIEHIDDATIYKPPTHFIC
jgi:hypothetical protein